MPSAHDAQFIAVIKKNGCPEKKSLQFFKSQTAEIPLFAVSIKSIIICSGFVKLYVDVTIPLLQESVTDKSAIPCDC